LGTASLEIVTTDLIPCDSNNKDKIKSGSLGQMMWLFRLYEKLLLANEL
jgi:hypothetical protein